MRRLPREEDVLNRVPDSVESDEDISMLPPPMTCRRSKAERTAFNARSASDCPGSPRDKLPTSCAYEYRISSAFGWTNAVAETEDLAGCDMEGGMGGGPYPKPT